jgi:response regulator NasT
MKPLRVVIADDDGLTLMLMRKVLTTMGHQVVGEAADGEQAVKMTCELKPDLVILDIRMPQMDGLEAARLIKEQNPTPVIILSAHSESGLGSQAADAGAHAYLVKPFTANQITPAIEVALGNFAKARQLEQKVHDLNESLESRKLIERAKGLLMREAGIDEETAYLTLQKSARNQNKKLVDVARALIMADELRRESAKGMSPRGPSRVPRR